MCNIESDNCQTKVPVITRWNTSTSYQQAGGLGKKALKHDLTWEEVNRPDLWPDWLSFMFSCTSRAPLTVASSQQNYHVTRILVVVNTLRENLPAKLSTRACCQACMCCMMCCPQAISAQVQCNSPPLLQPPSYIGPAASWQSLSIGNHCTYVHRTILAIAITGAHSLSHRVEFINIL